MTQHDPDTVSFAAAIDLIQISLDKQALSTRDVSSLGISLDGLSDLGVRLPETHFIELWKMISEQAQGTDIALNIGQTINPNAKGLLASWISQTSTLREALTTFISHISLMNPSESWQLTDQQGMCKLTFTLHNKKGYPQMAIERSMSAMVAWGQLLSGNQLTILKAGFAFTAPTYEPSFKKIFGENIHFDAQEHYLEFPPNTLDLPVISSNRLLKEMMADKAKSALSALTPKTHVIDKVRYLLNHLIDQQQPISVNIISEALAMSRQTLYRELKKHNTDFQSIFDNIRKEQAMILLKSGTESIDVISLKLGYKDNSSFYKAFKRWYDESPASFKPSK